uniref:alpha-N-acetylglucosaminidase TIM-barrel domain-containing protein n=1 Tax=Alloprevotella sp. TaxID=1872471 RepID=UPI004029B675
MQFVTAFLLFIGLADMRATAQVVENPKEVCDLLNRIGGEGTAKRIATAIDPSVASAGREAFVLTSQDGKPCIKGSNVSALTTGINWYLNHYAHVNIAWNNLTTDLSQVELPVPTKQEKHSTTVGYRYYLNYCTFSYSMSTWTWERWQKEIDWMALHGINIAVANRWYIRGVA